ncbi:hypothetical protein ACFL2Q_18800 [Thermodesulfobacteriota bacterium]
MGFKREKSKAMRLIPVLCAIVLLVSCKATWINSARRASGTIGAVKSVLSNPFRPVDHRRFSLSNSTVTLTNYRARPATSVTRKSLLTLADCRAIALKNNLEFQAAQMEQLTKKAIEFSNKTKMLPHFLLSGELSERDNSYYSYSEVLGREGRAPAPASTIRSGGCYQLFVVT